MYNNDPLGNFINKSQQEPNAMQPGQEEDGYIYVGGNPELEESWVPKAGTVENGYMFLGGDFNDENNWASEQELSDNSFVEGAMDAGRSLLSGYGSAVAGAADFFGEDDWAREQKALAEAQGKTTTIKEDENYIGFRTRNAVEKLNSNMSKERRYNQLRAQQIRDEAEGKGFLPEAGAELQAFFTDPLNNTAELVGSAMPVIGSALVAPAVGGGGALGATTGFVAGAMAGGGGAKRTAIDAASEVSFEDLRKNPEFNNLVGQGYSEQDAKRIMVMNAGDYARRLGGSISGATSVFGVERLAGNAVKGAVVDGAVKSALKAGGTEVLQGGLEGAGNQYIAQKVASEVNPDIDPMRGVVGAGVSEALGGGLVGGAIGASMGASKAERIANENNLPKERAFKAPAPIADGVVNETRQVEVSGVETIEDILSGKIENPLGEYTDSELNGEPVQTAPTTQSIKSEPLPEFAQAPMSAPEETNTTTPFPETVEAPRKAPEPNVMPGVAPRPDNMPSEAPRPYTEPSKAPEPYITPSKAPSTVDNDTSQVLDIAEEDIPESAFVQEAVAQNKPVIRKTKRANGKNLSLKEALAASGGINKNDASSTFGFDPADMDNARYGIRRAFTGNGMSLDSAVEFAAQEGYIPVDENGKGDIRDLEEVLGRELAGNRVMSVNDEPEAPEGFEPSKFAISASDLDNADANVFRSVMGNRFGAEGFSPNNFFIEESRDKGLNAVASAMGVRVIEVSEIFGNGQEVPYRQGSFNGFLSGRTVYINKSASNPELSVLGHEIFHVIEKDDSALAKRAIDSVVKYRGSKQWGEYKQKLIEAGYKQSELDSESTAEVFGYMLSDEKFLASLAKAEPKIFTKIANKIKQVIKQVSSFGRAQRDEAAGMLENYQNVYSTMQRVAKTYAKNYQSGKYDVDPFEQASNAVNDLDVTGDAPIRTDLPTDNQNLSMDNEVLSQDKFELESLTEDQTRSNIEKQEAVAKQERADIKADEDKALADSMVDDFVLTGSDRDVDIAEARGQGNLFDEIGDDVGLQDFEKKELLRSKNPNLNGKNADQDSDIPFSKNLEERNLVAVHELSAENLIASSDLGGLPVPSIGVVKTDNPRTGFAEITLIGRKDLADPKKGNKVFRGDAYSPMFPRKVDVLGSESDFRGMISSLEKYLGDFSNSSRFLKENKRLKDIKNLDISSLASRIANDQAFKEAFERSPESNVGSAGQKYIRMYEISNEIASKAFVGDFVEGKSGRPVARTLDNVTKLMKGEVRNRTGSDLFYNAGMASAAQAKQFRSMSEVKSDRDWVESNSEYTDVGDDLNARTKAFSLQMSRFFPDDYGFDGTNNSIKAIGSLAQGVVSKEKANRFLEKAGYRNYPESLLVEMVSIANEIKTKKVKYFESKPQRAVDIGEFAGAVVPADADPRAIKILEDKGVRVFKYSNEAERQSITQSAINEVDSQSGEVRFSLPLKPSVVDTPKLDKVEQKVATIKDPESEESNIKDLQYKGVSKPDNVVKKFADSQIGFKRLEQMAEKEGVDLEGLSVYEKHARFAGRNSQLLKEFQEEYIKPILKTIGSYGMKPERAMHYRLALHAPEANALIAKRNKDMPDGGSGLTNQQARDLLSGKDVTVKVKDSKGKKVDQVIKGFTPSESKRLDKVMDLMNRHNEAVLNIAENSGIEKPEVIAELRDKFQYYMPLAGQDDGTNSSTKSGYGSGFDVKNSMFKARTGRDTVASNLSAQFFGSAFKTITRASKNEVDIEVIRTIQKLNENSARYVNENGDPLFELNPKDVVRKLERYTIDTLRQEVADDLGVAVTEVRKKEIEDYLEATTDYDRTDPNKTIKQYIEKQDSFVSSKSIDAQGENVFSARVGGKNVVFRINDDVLANSLRSVKDDPGRFIDYLDTSMNYLRDIYTNKNPTFAPVNMLRDLGSTSLNAFAQGHFLGFAKNIFSPSTIKDSIGSALGKKESASFKEFARQGGKTGFFASNKNERKQEEMFAKQSEKLARTWANNPPRKALEEAFKLLELAGNVSENMVRYSVYKAGIDNGMSAEEAGRLVRTVSIDFNKKGDYTKNLNRAYLYFNASAQGTYNLSKALKTKKGQAAATAVVAGNAAYALIAALALGKDDDGEWLWNNEQVMNDRRNNILIPTPGAETPYIKIPLQYGYDTMTQIGNAAVAMYLAEDSGDAEKQTLREAGQLGASMVTGLLPGPVGGMADQGVSAFAPTLTQPIVQSSLNVNRFGSPLMPETYGRDVPDSSRYWANTEGTSTQELSKFLNEATGGTNNTSGYIDVSPETFNNWIRTLTGPWGSIALKKGGDKFILRDEGISDAPVISRFASDNLRLDSANVRKFRERANEIDNRFNDYKGYFEEGKERQAEVYLKQHPIISLKEYKNRVDSALENLKRKDDIDRELPDVQRKKNMRENHKMRMEIIKEFNTYFNSVRG